MTTHEEDIQILKEHLNGLITELESGEPVYVTGGHIVHSYKDRIIEGNCSKLITKLRSLGYEDTNNNGHGCKDHRFTKPIKL